MTPKPRLSEVPQLNLEPPLFCVESQDPPRAKHFCRGQLVEIEGWGREPGDTDVVPGWYFWDETWANHYGPFNTETECREALRTYCETL